MHVLLDRRHGDGSWSLCRLSGHGRQRPRDDEGGEDHRALANEHGCTPVLPELIGRTLPVRCRPRTGFRDTPLLKFTRPHNRAAEALWVEVHPEVAPFRGCLTPFAASIAQRHSFGGSMRRVTVFITACLVGVGLLVPTGGSSSAAPRSAESVLEQLPVKGRGPLTGYARAHFGPAWADVDRNGCDTRNDILKRDLTGETFRPGTHGCVVLSGRLTDRYTDKTIPFTKATASAVQVDHVVALADAWQKGAQGWDAQKRRVFANDPLNLQAVDGPTNARKGSGDAATWLPPARAYRCVYVARQVSVKAKYGLWVTTGERAVIRRVLSSCARQPVFGGGATLPPAEPVAPAPPAAPTPTPRPVLVTPTPAPPAPAPVVPPPAAPAPVVAPPASTPPAPQPPAPPMTAPPPTAPPGVYYANCYEARAAGAAPLYAGQPGYRVELDRDRDGVACE